MEGGERAKLCPGWYIQLAGEKSDLDDWVYTLNEPFDPVAIEEEDGTVLLKSQDFATATSASEAREKGLALVARLNGAMALMHSAGPVSLNNVIRVDAQGRRHSTVFAEAAGIALGRCKVRATATLLGPDGQTVPPPPPQPSAAQTWNELASSDDDVADLLEQLGRADSWYEIYKTIELAEAVCGGEHQLAKLLSSSRSQCKNMRTTANFYRHARARRPAVLTTLAESKPLLHFMVRKALDKRLSAA